MVMPDTCAGVAGAVFWFNTPWGQIRRIKLWQIRLSRTRTIITIADVKQNIWKSNDKTRNKVKGDISRKIRYNPFFFLKY